MSRKKQLEFAKQCHFTPKYSGDESKAFWNAVVASKNDALYVFACAVQDAEERLLREVNKTVTAQVLKALKAEGR